MNANGLEPSPPTMSTCLVTNYQKHEKNIINDDDNNCRGRAFPQKFMILPIALNWECSALNLAMWGQFFAGVTRWNVGTIYFYLKSDDAGIICW